VRPLHNLDRCLNCEADLRGAYCHACGQRAEDPTALSVVGLAGGAVREALSVDGRLGRTIGPFLFRPGFLVAEYLAGRRVRYTPPLRLFVAAVLIALVAMRIADRQDMWLRADARGMRVGLGDGPPDGAGVVRPRPASAREALGDGLAYTLFGDGIELVSRIPEQDAAHLLKRSMMDVAPSTFAVLVPLLALLAKLLFPRRRYAEHLVFALNAGALALLALAIGITSFRVPARGELTPGMLAVAALGLGVYVHLVGALRRIHGAGWLRAIASAIVLASGELVLFAIGVVAALMVAVATL
jgi:hypothetical protein